MAQPAKKRKVEEETPEVAAVGGLLFNQETFNKAKTYKEAHEKGEPYQHVAVQNLFTCESIRKIVSEARTHLNATFKETDLFKMYQTLDLANFVECEDQEVMELRAKVPSIVQLRDALYSKQFREFVQEVCGIEGELTERVDMAMQAYSKGGHLLCHDDVIGTRAVSFIIYLTDPDEPWETTYGGELELYPTDPATGLPALYPTKLVPPTSNSMVLFKVRPGVTYHAVAETLQDDTPRLSLQGWFHTVAPPAGAEESSSLSVLKREKKGGEEKAKLKEESAKQFHPLPGNLQLPEQDEGLVELSAQDLEKLRGFVSDAYLSADAWEKIRQKFAKDGSVQLREFLIKNQAAPVQAEVEAIDAKDGVGTGGKLRYETGVDPAKGATLVGSPITQRFIRYEGSGLQLGRVKRELIDTPEFAKLVAVMTGLRLLGQTGCVRRFRPGGDYTVAYHGLLEPDTRLDATLCFVKESDGWITGDIGGFECFIAAESSELVAAETYGNEDDASNDLLSVHAASNTLSLVARDEHMMRFVKYVSADAPGSRWDLTTTYQIECDESDDEEEEEEEEDEDEAEQEGKAKK